MPLVKGREVVRCLDRCTGDERVAQLDSVRPGKLCQLLTSDLSGRRLYGENGQAAKQAGDRRSFGTA